MYHGLFLQMGHCLNAYYPSIDRSLNQDSGRGVRLQQTGDGSLDNGGIIDTDHGCSVRWYHRTRDVLECRHTMQLTVKTTRARIDSLILCSSGDLLLFDACFADQNCLFCSQPNTSCINSWLRLALHEAVCSAERRGHSVSVASPGTIQDLPCCDATAHGLGRLPVNSCSGIVWVVLSNRVVTYGWYVRSHHDNENWSDFRCQCDEKILYASC
jgi:hypothetical protein